MSSASSNLILALKHNDQAAAKSALSVFINSMRFGESPASFLGLTDIKFKMLVMAINTKNLTKARLILKVELAERNAMDLDPEIYNPITGKIWC